MVLEKKIFGMPCGVDFPRSLASGILKFFSAHPPEVLARVNIFGGVVVTQRMLSMYKKKNK